VDAVEGWITGAGADGSAPAPAPGTIARLTREPAT